jgi:hypothetical protein
MLSFQITREYVKLSATMYVMVVQGLKTQLVRAVLIMHHLILMERALVILIMTEVIAPRILVIAMRDV